MSVPAVDPSIFKAYDVRGLYGEQIDEPIAYRIGRAFIEVLAELEGKPVEALRVALGRDMRLPAEALSSAYAEGMLDAGADVVALGMVGTEMLYCAVATEGLDGGLMCTASHNPKAYTGAKLVRGGALALSGDSGIKELAELISRGEPGLPSAARGQLTELDIAPAFRAAAGGFIDPGLIGAAKVVLDGGNGMAGEMVGPLLDRLPLDQTATYWTPDGEFPGHEPNPLLAENRRELTKRVLSEGAELGIAWDGDADRCFFVDDTGRFVDGDFLTALLAEAILAKNPGEQILYDVRASRAVAETVSRAGGTSAENRVGHAFFKTRMHAEGAIFGGEVSGHYYFRDFYCADSGTIPALLVLELISVKEQRLSELLAPYRDVYFISGEINSEVADPLAKMAELAERFSDGELSRLDGISINYPDWHFNVRPSNTEPLLRLNLESLISEDDMAAKRDLVLELIRS
ncbi:MAG: phosphomannomutase/phosphoglucomutase [Thermoleophilaceae bacterium]|nr:phosphomannomutase/phosphoglucomutase [Thermoleophilaceae bacterium]